MPSHRIDNMSKREYDMKVDNSIIHLMALLTPYIISRQIVVQNICAIGVEKIAFSIVMGERAEEIFFNLDTALWTSTLDHVSRRAPDPIVRVLVAS